MRFFDQGSLYSVVATEMDVDNFNDRWPASELRGLRGVTFQFDKKNGDLVDIEYRNGDSEQWDGSALVALSEDAQKYGEGRLGKTRKGWPATYTTAPPDYDWFGTFTEAAAGTASNGKHIRKVRSDPQHVQVQRERYMSGNNMAADETEWKKLVKYKLVTKNKELLENPTSAAPLLVAGALAAGLAWLLLRKKDESVAKSCASSDMLGAFGKYMGYDVFASPGLPNAGSPALAEITKNAKAKLYNEQDCQFHKWTGSGWVADQGTNAELAAFTSKIDSLAGVSSTFVGL